MEDFLAKPIDLDHLFRILSNIDSRSELEILTNSVDGSSDIDFERLDMIRETPDDGEVSMMTWVIDTFVADTRERLPRMQSACEQSDWSNLAEEAHRLYSGASNLGLIVISNICTEMELEADNPQVSKNQLMEQLVEAYERVLPELQRQKSLLE